MEIKDLKLEDLEAQRPDLVESITTKALQGLEESIVGAESAATGGAAPPAKPEAKPAENQGLIEANRRIEELEKSNKQLQARELVSGALAASGLSESARGLLLAEFQSALADEGLAERVKARIEAFKEYEKGVIESVRVPGLPGGSSGPTGGDFRMSEHIADLWGPAPKEGEK